MFLTSFTSREFLAQPKFTFSLTCSGKSEASVPHGDCTELVLFFIFQCPFKSEPKHLFDSSWLVLFSVVEQ